MGLSGKIPDRQARIRFRRAQAIHDGIGDTGGIGPFAAGTGIDLKNIHV
jgi:hypothetical protein